MLVGQCGRADPRRWAAPEGEVWLQPDTSPPGPPTTCQPIPQHKRNFQHTIITKCYQESTHIELLSISFQNWHKLVNGVSTTVDHFKEKGTLVGIAWFCIVYLALISLPLLMTKVTMITHTSNAMWNGHTHSLHNSTFWMIHIHSLQSFYSNFDERLLDEPMTDAAKSVHKGFFFIQNTVYMKMNM